MTGDAFAHRAIKGLKFAIARRDRQRARRSRSPASKQLIGIDVDRYGDVFGEREFVERFADKAA